MSRNIALVGCGAIAHQYHLRALANRRHDFDNVWVIDPSDAARQMACSIVAAEQCAALADVADDLHFVIVASPNTNHFTTARQALLRGADVAACAGDDSARNVPRKSSDSAGCSFV